MADELPDEAPEADALEQRQEAGDQTADDVGGADRQEVPEADALDQARIVATDDEPDPRG